MSFALTTGKIVNGTKNVTRRVGWLRLKPGEWIQPVEKIRGLKKGEKIVRIGAPLLVADVRVEPLSRMFEDIEYGIEECRREGFPELTPSSFVEMFCKTHKGCRPDTLITRIEFCASEPVTAPKPLRASCSAAD